MHAHGLRTPPSLPILKSLSVEIANPCFRRVCLAYDTTPRHATSRHARVAIAIFFFRANKKIQKDPRRSPRSKIYAITRIYSPYFSPLPRKFYGNLARNRIPSREELDDAVRARPSNFPTSIGRTNYANSVT